MTDRYEKIRRALAMGPTPGPWELKDGRTDTIENAQGYPVCTVHHHPYERYSQGARAAYILACDPDTIRELLAERDALAARLGAETSNARGEVEYEYEVWQDGVLQAGGREADYASAQSEARHYAAMYTPDGPVEVRIYEKRLLSTTQQPAAAQPQRRRYDPSGSLSEYGIFPECDAQPLEAPSETVNVVGMPEYGVSPERDAQRPAGDGCHCATCTCNPNMTPAVRFDLSPAQQEGAIREHLIRLGWTPPDEHAPLKSGVGDV